MNRAVTVDRFSERRWVRIVNWTAGILLGGVFLVAALAKAVDPILFVQQIRNEELDFLLSANQIALLALILETGLGLALITGIRSRWVLLLTGFLVVFFLFLTGRNYWLVLQGLRDESSSCGCFGSLVQRSPGEAFWQDLLLLVPPLAALIATRRAVRPSGFPVFRFSAATLGVSAVFLYTVLVAGMPPGDLTVPPEAVQEAKGEFLPAEGYYLSREGQTIHETGIFESARDLQFLLTSPEWASALLLDLKKGIVIRVPSQGVVSYADGSRQLLEEAENREIGPFQVASDGVRFHLNSAEFLLGQKGNETEMNP